MIHLRIWISKNLLFIILKCCTLSEAVVLIFVSFRLTFPSVQLSKVIPHGSGSQSGIEEDIAGSGSNEKLVRYWKDIMSQL